LIFSRQSTAPNIWLVHAALELKVLRSFSSNARKVSSTQQKKAIKDGLLQAIAYKQDHAAQIGMLCCFDMRRPSLCNGTACLSSIRSRAKKSEIELRHYRLYGSAADLRADRYGNRSTAA
jgi:hypothetical protein